jgi:hypothetical protein
MAENEPKPQGELEREGEAREGEAPAEPKGNGSAGASSSQVRRPSPFDQPAVRQYSLVCLLALLVVLILLLESGLGEWAVLVSALGCICMLLQVRFGPPLLLLAVAWLILSQGRGVDPPRLVWSILSGRTPIAPWESREFPFTGLLLATALLVYSVAFYRLLSVTQNIFPVDPRRKRWARALKGKITPGVVISAQEARPAQVAAGPEVPWLALSGLVWSLLAWAFWEWLASQRPQWGFNLVVWRGLVLFWLAALGLLLSSALLAYLRQAGAGAEASAVYLQDQLWQQTRREQSRINRWLVGARLRRQQKEEP